MKRWYLLIGWVLVLVFVIFIPLLAERVFPSPKVVSVPFPHEVVKIKEVLVIKEIPAPAEILLVDETWKSTGILRVIKTKRAEHEYSITPMDDGKYSHVTASCEDNSFIVRFNQK